MIVANSNPAGNPNSSHSAAVQEELQEARQELESFMAQLVSSVSEAIARQATLDHGP